MSNVKVYKNLEEFKKHLQQKVTNPLSKNKDKIRAQINSIDAYIKNHPSTPFKTVFPAPVLNSIWTGSALANMPIVKELFKFAKPAKNPPVSVNIADHWGRQQVKNAITKDTPIQLTEDHRQALANLERDPKHGSIDNFQKAKLALISGNQKPFKSLPAEAQQLYNQINQEVIHNQKMQLDRFAEYSVYPPYPTQPLELTQRQRDLLDKLEYELQQSNSPNLDALKKAKQELLTEGKLYCDLSDNARGVLSSVNLDLVKEHLKDIADLANKIESRPQLDHLGIDYYETEIYDTLARGLAFIDKRLLKPLLEDSSLQVPIKQVDGTFVLKPFHVERFNLSGGEKTDMGSIDHDKGHPIFFLKPVDQEDAPMIVARGTLLADDGTDGAYVSVQADGRKDLSMKWIMQNNELRTKMEDMVAENNKKFKVCGHSLGGNIAATLCVANPDLIDSAITISAAHVSKDVYNIWKKIPQKLRPKIDNIFVEGDLIPSGGRRILGMAIGAKQIDNKNIHNPVDRHLKPFNNTKVQYYALDKEKEQKKIGRTLASTSVTFLGRLIQDKKAAKKLTSHQVSEGTRKKLLSNMDAFVNIYDKANSAIDPINLFSEEDFTKFCNALKETISPKDALQIYLTITDPEINRIFLSISDPELKRQFLAIYPELKRIFLENSRDDIRAYIALYLSQNPVHPANEDL